jgi:predicted enzyme related to lactoylglutathione lyase
MRAWVQPARRRWWCGYVERMQITKAYFMVPVQDMERAVTFYGTVLGLQLAFSSPDWTELAWHDAVIALHRDGAATDAQRWLGFEVDDIDSALAEIEVGGGRREAERIEGGVRLVTVEDTEGNSLTIGGQPEWH